MKQVPIAILIVACLYVTALGNVNAAADITANLGNFRYSLVDLDPNDGIAPSLTLTAERPSSTSTIATDRDGFRSTSNTAAAPFMPVSDVQSGSYYNQSVALSGSGTFESVQLHVATHVDGSGMPYFDLGSSTGMGELTFVLSARTGLRFYADTSLQAFSAGLATGASSTSLTAIAVIDAYFGAQDNVFVMESAGIAERFDMPETTLPGSDSQNTTLSLIYNNTSNAALNGRMDIFTGVYVSQYALAVPEPASYLMLGLGLLMLGALCTRQRYATLSA